MNKVKYLLTYRYAEIIHDLTVEFVKTYILSDIGNLSNLRKKDYRQADQMNQAARSGKQNIVEGVGASPTSMTGEIKLLGVAKASFDELLSDFEDFLRHNKLEIYPKDDRRVSKFRQTAFRLSDLGQLIEKAVLPGNPQDDANFLLTLCHQVTFLLDRQIKAAEKKFIKEGGHRERLFNARKKKRGY